MSPTAALVGYAWRGDAALAASEIPDFWEHASDRDRAAVTGHFAAHWQRGSRHRLVRDPLGVHKLFFTIVGDEVRSSQFAHDLVSRGASLRHVWSVPSGHWIELDVVTREYALRQYATLPYGDAEAPIDDLGAYAAAARARLEAVFRRLARTLRGREIVVTMSGGLDSSTIAVMAREHLGAFRAITFTTPDATPSGESDLRYARMMAQHLGVALEVVEVAPARVLGLVDRVLVDGQDFRDFNVHCGLVNAALAEYLASSSPAEQVVLTGDGMNELVADYTPVEHGGDTFYSLPELDPGRLRRFLVAGLDSGDREVGVFGRRGISVFQPYLLCADAYTRLPGGFLRSSVAKQDLVRRMMGSRIPGPIYARTKVRAQVGSGDEVGGTLAALVAAGLDQEALLARFAELFDASAAEAKAFIRGGLYRFSHKHPGAADGRRLDVAGDR